MKEHISAIGLILKPRDIITIKNRVQVFKGRSQIHDSSISILSSIKLRILCKFNTSLALINSLKIQKLIELVFSYFFDFNYEHFSVTQAKKLDLAFFRRIKISLKSLQVLI